MSDLTEFLLARISEDEAVARAATEKDPHQAARLRWSEVQKEGTLKIEGSIMESMGWEFGGGSGIWQCDDPEDDCDEYRGIAWREAAHIARHDPARVLAECEAKRRIVELRYSWDLQAERAPESPFGPILKTQVVTADTVLRTLATVYSDHPDYREAWRP